MLRLFAVVCVALGVIPLANLLTEGKRSPGGGSRWRSGSCEGSSSSPSQSVWPPSLVRGWIRASPGRGNCSSGRPRAHFAFGMSVLTFAAAAFLARYCFAGQPFTTDEMAQQWHARILLSGRLWAVSRGSPRVLQHRAGLRPGRTLVLSVSRWRPRADRARPALRRGVAGESAADRASPPGNLHRFLAAAFDALTARLVTLLFALSPMVLIMAASQMNHVPTLAFALLALASLAEWDRADDPGRRRRNAAFVGIGLGLAALVRPLDAALVGAVVIGFQGWRVRQEPDRWRSLVIRARGGSRTRRDPALDQRQHDRAPVPVRLRGAQRSGARARLPRGSDGTDAYAVARPRADSGYLMRLSRYLFEWPLPGLAGDRGRSRRPPATIALGRRANRPGARFPRGVRGLLVRRLLRRATLSLHRGAGVRLLRGAGSRRPGGRSFASRLPDVPSCSSSRFACSSPGSARTASPAPARGSRCLWISGPSSRRTSKPRWHGNTCGTRWCLVNEGWRGRLLARLRVLGISQFRADQIVSGVDACGLEGALDAEDSLTGSDAERAERVIQRAKAMGQATAQPGLPGDQAIALVPGSMPTARCLAEFRRDTAGTMPYPLFLARQRVGSDGRVGGDVVFARDLGPRNDLLRDRFGTRSWYRYRPARSLDDTTSAFVSYDPSGRD